MIAIFWPNLPNFTNVLFFSCFPKMFQHDLRGDAVRLTICKYSNICFALNKIPGSATSLSQKAFRLLVLPMFCAHPFHLCQEKNGSENIPREGFALHSEENLELFQCVLYAWICCTFVFFFFPIVTPPDWRSAKEGKNKSWTEPRLSVVIGAEHNLWAITSPCN